MDNARVRSNLKVVVVLPAYNAEKTLKKTVDAIPRQIVNDIILVDDHSTDRTFIMAKHMGLAAYRHAINKGYGANQKTCYQLALNHGADIVVMLHPDYQYDPRYIKPLVSLIAQGKCEVALGSRIRTCREALDAGMPLYKYLGNRLLTSFENLVTGQHLSEWHTGMRAFSRRVLEDINFMSNPNSFVFDSQILFQVVEKGYRIGEISVPIKYLPEASSISFPRSVVYGIGTLAAALRFLLKKGVKALANMKNIAIIAL